MEQQEIEKTVKQLSQNLINLCEIQGAQSCNIFKKDIAEEHQIIFKDLMDFTAKKVRSRGYECVYNFQIDGEHAVCRFNVSRKINSRQNRR